MPSDPKSHRTAVPNRTYYGRFSDGKSAAATDAGIRFALSGLEIDTGPGTVRRIWPYDKLRTLEPIHPNAIDVLLSSPGDPGSSLFVPGPEFAKALVEHAPHLSSRAHAWHHARPWLILAGILVGAIALVYATGWSPVKQIAGLLPETWRERLGDEARDSMTEGHNICVDAGGTAALDKLSERLSKAAGLPKPFKITVYDWSLMNAFAVPGGQIVVTKELIAKAQTPDEVAGVLAHEMGHGIGLHPETSIIRAIGLAAAVELMMGGSSGALANLGVMLAQLGYSRASEREADEIGLGILKNAAISPRGLGDFFKRVEKMEDEDGDLSRTLKPFSILRTHPPTAERAALVRRQPPYPATPALDAQSWGELQAICSKTRPPEPKSTAG